MDYEIEVNIQTSKMMTACNEARNHGLSIALNDGQEEDDVNRLCTLRGNKEAIIDWLTEVGFNLEDYSELFELEYYAYSPGDGPYEY